MVCPVEEPRAGNEGQASEPHRAREKGKQPDPDDDGDKAADHPQSTLAPTVVSAEDGLDGMILGRTGRRWGRAFDGCHIWAYSPQ